MPSIILESFCNWDCIFTRLMKLSQNIKIFLRYFLGPLLFLWLSYSIYHAIKAQPNLLNSWQVIKDAWKGPQAWKLFLALGLVLVNWSIEAIKWQIVVKHLQEVSLIRSLKAILSGVSFAVSTPNRVGEYAGRVLYLNEGNRMKAVSLTIVSSISQLLITLIAGFIGAIQMCSVISSEYSIGANQFLIVLAVLFAIVILVAIFYFKISWFTKLITRLSDKGRYLFLIDALSELKASTLLKLLLLSAIRFLVFIIQYALLFSLFGVSVSAYNLMPSLSVYFLIMAVVPTIAITELGIRGGLSIWLIGLFSVNKAGIVFATISIWFINLIIPAIIGSVLMLGNKKITDS
jgi:hypothetical protein